MIYFQKAIFLEGVRSQVERVVGELKRMQYFLNDAQARQNGDERVGNWVSKIQNAAYIYIKEDIIDMIITSSSRSTGQIDLNKGGK